MSTLNNKTVFITGAPAGIGQAMAHKLSEAGARILICARREDRLKQLQTELSGEVHVFQLDVRDRQAVEAAIAALPAEWRDIDILVNNAGLSRGLAKLHEGNPDGWDEMLDTNVKGLLYVSRAVIPGMVVRGKGHIINVGSIAGREVYPGGNVYCATKFAVRALTAGMRIDLVDTPIRVSTIDPGLVQTEFSEVRFYGDKERAAKVYQGYTPLAPEDIAEAAVWVASRPPHVQIAEVLILPTDQAGSTIVHKR